LVNRKPVTIKDLFKLRLVSDPRFSPDGGRIAFVHTTFDYEKDEYVNDIWMADAKTGVSTQFTSGRGKDKGPRWSPDGKRLLFTSTPPAKEGEEKKKPQLYVIEASGGEARRLTAVKLGVEAPKWSPDDKQILFMSPTQPVEPKGDVKHITRLSYKFNGRGFFQGVYKHVFTVPLKGGKPKQVTKGEYKIDGAEWMGSDILFYGNVEPDADIEDYDHIYRVGPKGEPVQLTQGNWSIHGAGGGMVGVCPSPDGKEIAFAGHDYRRSGATKADIWIMPVVGGAARKLTEGYEPDLGVKMSSDVRVGSLDQTPLWRDDGYVYFTSNFAGVSTLNRVKAKGGKVEKLLGEVDYSVEAWSLTGKDHIVYSVLATTRPADLWIRNSGKDRQITDFNKKWCQGLDLRPHERFAFKSSSGHTVEGWIMKPSGLKKGKKYPMAVEIHGGPRGVFGNSLMHEHQVLAGKGYVVMYINPWGSGGYTEDFQANLPGHYGEQDYADIMEAVDYCIKNYPWVDGERLACLGGSYGGFMTNWIVTHTTRFRAAVTMRSISNWVSFFGTSDIGWTFGKREMLGTPWDNEEEFMAKSPIRYVKNVKTPTLVLHSEEDYRCPMEQGEQFYTALKYLGVPTEFVRFPGENHELSRSGKPKHREARLEHVLRWFEKYL